MAEVILRKINQLKATINLRYAAAAVTLWSLSYFISCYIHTSPSTAALHASAVFSSSDVACSASAFPDHLLDFTSHHSADILLNSEALLPIPPPPPYPQGGALDGETSGVQVSDSDSLRLQDVSPVATLKPRRGLLRQLGPGLVR